MTPTPDLAETLRRAEQLVSVQDDSLALWSEDEQITAGRVLRDLVAGVRALQQDLARTRRIGEAAQAQREAAEARVTALEAERENLFVNVKDLGVVYYDDGVVPGLRNDRAEAAERRVQIVEAYVQHCFNCPMRDPGMMPNGVRTGAVRPRRAEDPPAECTCGLDAALRQEQG